MSNHPKRTVQFGVGFAAWLCYAFAFSLALLTFKSLRLDPLVLLYKATVPGALIVTTVAIPVFLGYDMYRFKQK